MRLCKKKFDHVVLVPVIPGYMYSMHVFQLLIRRVSILRVVVVPVLLALRRM